MTAIVQTCGPTALARFGPSSLEATFDHYVAELARHLPAFAPTIYALWDHILESPGFSDTLCCQEPTHIGRRA
jgi:hypothetical protein